MNTSAIHQDHSLIIRLIPTGIYWFDKEEYILRLEYKNWQQHIFIYRSNKYEFNVFSLTRPGLEPGADPGFQVRGGGVNLKKLRRAAGGANIFEVFRVKNHDFTPKNHIFSNFRPPPHGSAPANPWSTTLEASTVAITPQMWLQYEHIIFYTSNYRKEKINPTSL
jgi:hypothetical protein